MLTLVKEVARWYFKCRSCDHRWSELTREVKVCPRCRGEAVVYGHAVERVAE